MRGSKPGGRRRGGKEGRTCDYYLQSTCKKRWGQPSSSWVQQRQQLQLPYRAACCTMRKIGAEINELAPRRAAVGLQHGPGPQLQAQPVSRAPQLSLYTINHIPYTICIQLFGTRAASSCIHNWAAEYAEECFERVIKIPGCN